MKDYNINVNFQDGSIESNFMELVQNDYNTTTLKFKFDTDNRVVFKMLYPDNETEYVVDIEDNQLILGPGILSQDGLYRVELASYPTDGRVTAYATMEFYVRKELVNTDEIVEPDDRVPILDNLINEVDNINISATKEDDVATIIVTKKDGTTETVEVYDGEIGPQGEQGPKGDKGDTGSQGPQGIQGPKGDTGPQGIQGPKGDKGDTGSQGAVGPAGATGPQGPKGDKGDKGDTGSQGPTGPQGPKGDKGDPGLTQQEVQDLIDASIEELGELGFTPTVVQTLPTQDIDIHTIYLVPKTGETGDVYDEYVYINNAWEHIGSTAVDLSNYYTKSEVNGKVPYILELTETDQYKIPNKNSTIAVRNATDIQKMSDMINELYNKAEKYNYIIIKYPTRSVLIGISSTTFNTQRTTYQFQCLSMNSNVNTYNDEDTRYIKLSATRLVINGGWTNNIFTATSGLTTWEKEVPINDRYYMNNTFLSKTNTSSYTPTTDYHPATKKYVDDAVASVPTPDMSDYYTKSEVNIIANAKLPYYKLDLTTIISNGKVNLNTTDLEALSVIFTDAYSKEYTAINILMTATYNNGKVMQVLLMPSSKSGQYVISNNLTSYVFEYFCNQGYVGYPADQSDYNVIFGWLNVNNIVWNDNVCTVGACQFNGTLNTIPTSQGVLLKNNTFSYTPTANFHPATKKYVDDAISSVPTPDMSNYYTKSDVDGLIPPLFVLELTNNRADSYGQMGIGSQGNNLQVMSDFITNVFSKNITYFELIVKFSGGFTTPRSFVYRPNASLTKGSGTNYYYFYSDVTSEDQTSGTYIRIGRNLRVDGTWNDDVFTCSAIRVDPSTRLDYSQFLTSTNTTAYTPTGDYNPATKKYVDDSIASAITDALGGNY